MKRFGTIFPFLESGHDRRHIGRLVANHDFARALIRYGNFDEFVFSNPSVSNLRLFAEEIRGWGLAEERLARVKFVGYVGLPTLLRSTPFHVFHLGGWGWFMAGLHYVRARYASNPWPITAVIHSLTGRDVIDHAVRLSHAGMAPYDAVFCTSRDGRAAMRRLIDGAAAISGGTYAGRLEHLPLGIDDDLIDRPGDGSGVRARLRIPADAFVILVLGRVTPTQKMDLAPLLRTFAQSIAPRSPRPVCLLVAGSATPSALVGLKDLVARLGVERSVRIYPNFPAGEKPGVLAAADLLVSPVDNAQETFGLSLLESLGSGVPVVASRYDGYKDLVEDGVDGFLVDTVAAPADPVGEWFDLLDPDIARLFQSQGLAVDMAQLAERVLRLVSDEALRAGMGRAGRSKVEAVYRWSRVIAAYEEAWDRLAHEASRAGIAPPRLESNPYNLGSSELFSGYPSRILQPSDRIRSCRDVLDESPFNEVAPWLPDGLLSEILRMARGGVEVAEVLAACPQPGPQVWFAVQWLLKYQFLALVACRQ